MRTLCCISIGIAMFIPTKADAATTINYVYCPQTQTASVTILGSGNNQISVAPTAPWRIRGVRVYDYADNQPVQLIGIDVLQENNTHGIQDINSTFVVGPTSIVQFKEMEFSSTASPIGCLMPVLQHGETPQ